jgi:hypothetical protein
MFSTMRLGQRETCSELIHSARGVGVSPFREWLSHEQSKQESTTKPPDCAQIDSSPGRVIAQMPEMQQYFFLGLRVSFLMVRLSKSPYCQ